MPAQAVVLFDHDARPELLRWSLAAAIVLAAHAGLMASYLLLRSVQSEGAQDVPAIMVDLAPVPESPESRMDIAPGPEVIEEKPQPQVEAVQQPEPDPVVEPSPAENPEVVLKIEPPKPEVQQESKPEVKPDERSVQETVNRSLVQTAPVKTDRVAPTPAAPRLGTSSQANSVIWLGQLMAHLNRFKQYPAAARGAQGIVTVTFTMDRKGRVLEKTVSKSSGSAALDEEALAMLSRAQPLPPFPSGMEGETRSFNAPIRFSVR